MGRQGLSKEQVFETAAALVEEGVAPTVPLVRERLGSGSFSTVSAHLAAWRKEHAAKVVADVQEMPEKVRAAFQQVWALASRSAQADMETQRLALEAMRREMDRERADMTAEIERLEAALETATERAERLDTALGEARQAGEKEGQQLMALRIENARLDERAKAADERTKAADARAAEFKAQVEDLQGKLAAAARPQKPPAIARKPAVPTPKPSGA